MLRIHICRGAPYAQARPTLLFKRRDRAKEYGNELFYTLYLRISTSSCTRTPQQNATTEREAASAFDGPGSKYYTVPCKVRLCNLLR